MKKTLSLAEQVKAARREVESWPDSVRSATEFRYSDFFTSTQEDTELVSARSENAEGKVAALEA